MSLSCLALPSVWRAHELARSEAGGLQTGYAALNAVLPGGGWPRAGLTELWQPHPGCGEWGLLGPALARLGTSGRITVLVAAPYVPFGPALSAANLVPSELLWVQAASTAERLWTAEQALRCADVACVLLWLDQAQSAQLRRLHLAAQEHAKPLFVLRPERAQNESSPAPLRLWVRWKEGRSGQEGQGGQEAPGEHSGAVPPLWVRVLKRRGPPLEASLPLLTASPGLRALLAASRAQARRRRGQAVPGSLEPAHAVDRAASLV
jgi:protein ImuA